MVVSKEVLTEALRNPLPGWSGQRKMSVLQDEKARIAGRQDAKQASVLITIIEESQSTILIERAHHPQDHHKGQISFPGGKKESSDHDLLHTALREAHEEIGLHIDRSEIIGSLSPLYIPVSNFLVHPYITILPKPVPLKPEPSEVHRIWHMPVQDFSPKKSKSTSIRTGSGLVLPQVPYYPLGDKKVWGATAMILAELSELLYLYHTDNNREI